MTSVVTSVRNENGVNNENALVIRRTVLYDLSVLVTRKTMQIDSRPMEIIIYFFEAKNGDLRG